MALQEHTYLLAQATFAELSGRSADARATQAVLDNENTPEIRDLLGPGLSFGMRDQFATAWQNMTLQVLNYATAYHNGDQQQANAIWNDRFNIADQISAPLLEGFNALDQQVLKRRMEEHVELMLGTVDIMHAQHPIDGYWSAWSTKEFLQPLGDQLAEALVRQVPAQFVAAAGTTTPTTRTSEATLQDQLALLLHEHGLLLSSATAAILDGRLQADTPATLNTLDARNSIPLSNLISSYYGSKTGLDFLALWREQVHSIARYADDVRTGDTAAQAAEQADQLTTVQGLVKLLAAAGPKLDKAALQQALTEHVSLALRTVQKQKAGPTEERYSAALALAQQGEGIASILSNAIISQFPERVQAEDALYSALNAWNMGQPQNYLSYYSNQAIQQLWGADLQTVAQRLGPTVGSPALNLDQVLSVQMSGNKAIVEWEGSKGIALQHTRTTLSNVNGKWLIASEEPLSLEVPRGVTAQVKVSITDAGLLFDPTLLNGGYVAFIVQNTGQAPYDLALYEGSERIASTGMITPGGSTIIGFTVPLGADQYQFVVFKAGPGGTDDQAAGVSAQFTVPYVATAG